MSKFVVSICLFSGFGAKLPPTGHVSHQFPLNGMQTIFSIFFFISSFEFSTLTLFIGNASHPYCSSIEEILVHYRTQLNSVQLYGPTNFAPVINNTISIATQFQDGRHYFVLLIITDGIKFSDV